MSSEWVKFTDVLEAIIDNRGRTCPVSDFGLPLIATNCVNGTSLYPTYQTNRYVSEETYKNWFRGHPKPDDILFVCKGSPGRTNWVPDPVDFCIAQDMVAVRADPTKIYPKFLFAALRSKIVQDQINNMHVGTMIPHFKKGDFDKLLIPNIEMQKQIEIGDLYFSFSKRIELLRETNQTLEAIAQALFKSWFVDFDPVRAKVEGRLPDGMDAATAALFPDAFEETALGLVPRGWSAATLSTVATFQNGYAFKGSDWSEVGHPVVKIGNVKPLHIDFDGCSFVSPETVVGLERFKLGAGDLLVGMTGYVGETGLVPHNDTASYLNQRVGRITTKNSLKDLGFVFSAVRQKEFKIYAESQSHGSAQANVSGADLMKFPVTVPSADILEKYNELTHQFIASILNNHSVATSLTSLRDTLLPRLISGQLRIADAEVELEKATA